MWIAEEEISISSSQFLCAHQSDVIEKGCFLFFVNSASAGEESHTGKKELRERQSIHISSTRQESCSIWGSYFLSCIACVCAYLFICKSRVVRDVQPSNRIPPIFSFASPNTKLCRLKWATLWEFISAAQQPFFLVDRIKKCFIPGTRQCEKN